MAPTSAPSVGIIGGSGLYDLLNDPERHDVTTPYGLPSAPVAVGGFGGSTVAFIPRHGRHHELPPHRVNYQANVAALAALGVRQILAPCAVGSLRSDIGPGSFVVPDQVVDLTHGRAATYVEQFEDGPRHASFADPYCPQLRSALLHGARDADWLVVDGGAMVVIDGPRFSTRAESQFYAAQGWSLVNMTGMPEAVLARELGICYAPAALVTDLDAGLAGGTGVAVEEVLRVFSAHVPLLIATLAVALTQLPEHAPHGPCAA